MRTIGTVVRGVRAPIIREGDNIAEVAAASVMEAWKEAGIEPRDRDVVAVTESVVARAQGNYATLDQIAKDVREKTGGGTVGVAFPILSRNRFSLLLRGMAMGCKKIVLLLSYPSDEVGNGLVDWDKLDEAGVDPYSDVLTLEQFRKKFGAAVHPFTGVDYIDFYSGIITDAGAEVEVIFGNRVQTLCDYTDAVITCDIHTRARSKRCDDAEAALSDFDARPAERPRSLLPYIIVSAVLLLLFIFVPALPSPVALAGCIVSGAALAALLVLNWNNARKVRAAHEEKRGVLEQALRDARSDAAAQQKLYDAAVRELLVLIPAGDISRVGAYLDAALQKYAELDALTREARDLSLRCELLSARAPKGDVPDKPVVRPARSRAELQTALDALARCRREAQSTFDYTSGRCRAIGDAAELEAALTQKRDELAQKQAEYDAIALAMESLQSANTALQNRFSPALSRRAGELFSRLTGGKYESVLLDRTFSAQAGETGESVSHDAQLLSLGTLDQLYLAVRLAICESALPADDPPPIVLDDAPVRFDDERCRAALELLLEESKSRQILLFTCQHRESAYLSGRDGVTFLSL